MKKLLYGIIGCAAVVLFADWAMNIDARFSDDAILLSMVIATSAGVLSAR